MLLVNANGDKRTLETKEEIAIFVNSGWKIVEEKKSDKKKSEKTDKKSEE